MTFFSMSESAITLRIPVETVTLNIDGQQVQMQKINTPLPFARKPCTLRELGGGELSHVYVFKRIDMDPIGFDYFARNLLRDADWLDGHFCPIPVANARACVMVVATDRPILFVDTQGSKYARYVARLG